MTAVPVILEGCQQDLAIIAANLQNVRAQGIERPRELQIAQSYVLGALGEILYDYDDRDRRSQRRSVYVAREGARVVTLCYRKPNDSGSLQIAYDSVVDQP